jgi:hypothetical protein
MESKLLELLKAKFVGVSDTTLSRIAKKKAVAAKEETELPAIVEAITWESVLQSEVDFKLTEANKKAVENYEKTHGLKEGKPVKPEQTPTDDVPEWYKKILGDQKTEVDALKKQLSDFQTNQLKSTLKKQVLEKVAGKISPAFLEVFPIDLDDITKVEEVANSAIAAYAKIQQELVNGSVVFDKPAGGSVPTNDPAFSKFLKDKFQTVEQPKT